MVAENVHPFGSRVKRFGKITGHPNLDPNGLYIPRPDGCDPCLYHPKPANKICIATKKTDKGPWKYKNELEEWSKNLGYRNQKVLDRKRWFDSILGPAWHDIPDAVKHESACKNVGFGRTPRFKPSKNNLPGPGTYYTPHPFKAPFGPHSDRPSFEREEPCRFKDRSFKWSLAPNRYKIIDKECIEQKPHKVVSLRGPYDLFSGKRSDCPKNHFNTSSKCLAETWPIALKGTLDKYSKSHFGTMNKTNRKIPYKGRIALVDLSMCLRRPGDPGPAEYDVDKPKTFKQNMYGFNSSYDKPPGYQRVVVWPGVGRYNLKGVRCGLPGQGHRHVFLSKQQRTIGAYLPQPMNTF